MRYYIFILLLVYAILLSAQKTEVFHIDRLAHFQHISNKNGLLSEDIKTTLRDKDGYLWIGSVKGLSRFDGQHFIHFTSMGKRNGKDVSTPINSLDQDKDGNIWIAHKEGISRLNPKTFDIKYYNPIHNLFENHRTANCIQVLATKQMGIIAGSYWGLWVYQPSVDSFQVFVHKQKDVTSLPKNWLRNKLLINSVLII